jgi:hypothetical protein
LACWVDNVSNDVTPKVTRAGATSGLIQKETHFAPPKRVSSSNHYQKSMATYGHDDDEAGRNVSVEEVVAETPFQDKHHLQTGEVTSWIDLCAVVGEIAN